MGRNLKECRVLVTPTSYGAYDKSLCTELEAAVGQVTYNDRGRALTSDELKELLPGYDGMIAGVDKLDRAAIEAADRLQVISRYGVGVDSVDLEAAAAKGITVTNTPTAMTSSVAELAIGLLLSLARSIPQSSAQVREGKWPRVRGKCLEGSVIGLLGFGAIGREVARRLQPWHATILAYDPFGDESLARALNVRLVGLDELVREADFLSLHAPLIPETRGVVNAEFLARMKKGSYLVNAARGELVDEAALVAALESGQLAGAALDVYVKEPPAPDNPLLKQPNLIGTPHCASGTNDASNRMGREALSDCLAVLRGEAPVHPVRAPAAKA